MEALFLDCGRPTAQLMRDSLGRLPTWQLIGSSASYTFEGNMENVIFLAPFIPFLAMLPPSFAAIWIANRWLKTRGTNAELQAELKTLRDDVATLRQVQAESQERLDFAERMLAQLREGRRELPNGAQ
jgi:hypothetical protein